MCAVAQEEHSAARRCALVGAGDHFLHQQRHTSGWRLVWNCCWVYNVVAVVLLWLLLLSSHSVAEIVPYWPDNIDEQLRRAARRYFTRLFRVDRKTGRALLPRMLSWVRKVSRQVYRVYRGGWWWE